jgi:hypothetical protein
MSRIGFHRRQLGLDRVLVGQCPAGLVLFFPTYRPHRRSEPPGWYRSARPRKRVDRAANAYLRCSRGATVRSLAISPGPCEQALEAAITIPPPPIQASAIDPLRLGRRHLLNVCVLQSQPDQLRKITQKAARSPMYSANGMKMMNVAASIIR